MGRDVPTAIAALRASNQARLDAQRGRMKRPVNVALDKSTDGSDMYRLSADCGGEVTEVIIVGGLSALGYDSAEAVGEALKGDLGRRLLQEHVARCGACSDWEAAL